MHRYRGPAADTEKPVAFDHEKFRSKLLTTIRLVLQDLENSLWLDLYDLPCPRPTTLLC